jgi:trimethylamine--corrinoid protein Co-methyltransferase
VDALPNLDFLMSYGIPSDVPLGQVYPIEFLQMVNNSVKPIVFTADNGAVCKNIIDMAALVAGGEKVLKEKPFVLAYSQPTSPLRHSKDALDKVLSATEAHIPVVYPPGMMPGATGPTTLAGAVTQSLAEAFSLLVIQQLAHQGAPIILCGAHGCLDMRTMVNVYAAPERLMTQAALASIYQHFRLPTWGFGGCTDALVLDPQAGMEFGMMSLWAALCGVNLAHDVGYLGSGLIGDLRAIVLNDEINSYVRHVLRRGISVGPVHLALDVIQRIGPGGDYLGDQHTFDHFRTEFWRPGVSNRALLGQWEQKGRHTLNDALTTRVKEALGQHRPKPLDEKLTEELRRMVRASGKEC